MRPFNDIRVFDISVQNLTYDKPIALKKWIFNLLIDLVVSISQISRKYFDDIPDLVYHCLI